MPITKPTSPVKASTQSFIEIEEVRDDILVMKDSSAALVLEVGAVNFWLLSQEEQASIISAYGGILNSLSFPVQILILSKRMDISSYLEYIATRMKKQDAPKLKTLFLNYENFIKNTVKKSSVLEKRFFFVIPFSPLEMGIQANTKRALNKEYVVSRAKTALYPKRDNLLRLLEKVGLKAATLHQQELVELFYNLYNPSATGRPLATVESYTDVVMTPPAKP